jgi:DNA-binding Xre family transcriptional regulator
MAVSMKIKALLSLCGKKQSDLMDVLGMSSRQSLSNKFTNERWSASDLVAIADFCDAKIAFILPDGTQLALDAGKTPDA